MKTAHKAVSSALLAFLVWAVTAAVPSPPQPQAEQAVPSPPQAASTPETIVLGPGTVVRNVEDPFDYFSNSWALIGLKDFPDGTRLSPTGEFLLGGGRACQLLAGDGLFPVDSRVKRTLAKGYLPIVVQDFILNDAVRVTVEALAVPLDDPGRPSYEWPLEPNFLNLVRVGFRNLGRAPAKAVAGFGWRPAAPELKVLTAQKEWALSAGEDVLALLSAEGPLDVIAAGPVVRIEAALTPEGTARLVMVMPFKPLAKPGEEGTRRLARLNFEDWKVRTAAAWDAILARGARLEIPEAKAQQAYLASLVYQFIGRDKAELHAGEGFYDNLYLRDGAYQAVSLAHAGFLSEARESLEFFPRYQRESGQFWSQPGQLDANGYAVWALAEYGRLAGDVEWLKSMFPRLRRAVAWVEKTRRTDRDVMSLFFGIMPPAPADGENLWAGKNHILGYDWWNLRAVQSTADVAARLGLAEEETALRAESVAYRRAILRAVEKTGLAYYPPSYEKEGTHWGNLEAVFPSELIGLGDARLGATLSFVRDEFGRGEGAQPGFIEGVIQWTPKTDAIHPYMSLFVTNTHLVRGEQEKAVDGFYAFLLHSTSTHGFPEGVYYKKREAWGDTIPHLWAAALYVTTVRNMIVREAGRELHLLSAVPAGWLEPGRKVSIAGAPTRLGRVSVEAAAEKDQINIKVIPPDRQRPDRIVVHLPLGLAVAAAVVDESVKLSRGRAGEIILEGPALENPFTLAVTVRRTGAKPVNFETRVAEFLKGR